MTEAFILMEKGYEYDDNYYNETEGGNPKKIFFNREEAELERKKLDLERFKNESIRNYTYDIDDVILDEEAFTKLTDSLLEKYGKPTFAHRWQSLEDYQLHPDANEEESNSYMKLVDFSFYEVRKVEVDKASFRNHQIDSVLD